jgi:formylglycine-generating enzyme required for sulfatase activity
VWEWVQDDYGGEDPKVRHLGVVRGGSFRSMKQEELLASHRRPIPLNTRGDEIGFRVVLSEEGVIARREEE